jgi:hypothetical protein
MQSPAANLIKQKRKAQPHSLRSPAAITQKPHSIIPAYAIYDIIVL